MKKCLTLFGILLLLFINVNSASCKMPDISEARKNDLKNKIDTGVSLIIYKDNDLAVYNEHNLEPLLNYLDSGNFKNSMAFDKTVGRAAAYLYVYGGAEYVYAQTISKPAIKILEKNNVKYEAKYIVQEIKNKENTDICPFEKLTKNAKNPTQAYGLIYKKTYPNTSIVYFTPKITPENIVNIYETNGKMLKGKVAVKLHSGEPGGHNFLQPNEVKPIVKRLRATIVECNTAYEGRRNTTEKHKQAIKEHGFDKVAKVDIMDADAELVLPVKNGKQIKVNYVGSHLKNYNSMLVLSHFKGHQMGGFGGALKNMSIGIASSHGKAYIHGAGDTSNFWNTDQDAFLESMADADKSVMDFMGNNMTFINVMTRMSIDCDCNNHPATPEMKDIGILASDDPVALDQACLDLVYRSNDAKKKSLIERIESKHGVHTIEAAADLGIGTRNYKLIEMK